MLNAFTNEWKHNDESLTLKKEGILTKTALYDCAAQAILSCFLRSVSLDKYQ